MKTITLLIVLLTSACYKDSLSFAEAHKLLEKQDREEAATQRPGY